MKKKNEQKPDRSFSLGGKWTTYRSMAIDAVDAAVKSAGLKQERPSSTDGLILDGGYHWTPNYYIKLAQDYGKLIFKIMQFLNSLKANLVNSVP